MKIVTMVMAVAILLNTLAPTLAHAATYLQDAEVNANTLVRDAYVQVTYRDNNDQEKLAKGWIDTIGKTSFTIRSGALFGKKTITYDKVLSVIMSDESTLPTKQMNEVNRFRQKKREIERKADIKTRPTVARKIGTGLLTGGLCAIAGGFTGMAIGDISAHNCEGDLCGFDVLVYMGLGMAIGYTIGVPIGVSKIDPHDQFRDAMLGSLLGAGAGIAITSANNQFAMSLVIFPLIGATIMSEQSRDTYENRRFSVGLAPAPDGNVRAIATLRF